MPRGGRWRGGVGALSCWGPGLEGVGQPGLRFPLLYHLYHRRFFRGWGVGLWVSGTGAHKGRPYGFGAWSCSENDTG